MRMRFDAVLWQTADPTAAWHFLTLPPELAADLRELPLPPRGFGSIRVRATIGATTWATSVFPDSKSASYVLPVKAGVRKAESIADGSPVSVELELAEAF